jgi:lysozyme
MKLTIEGIRLLKGAEGISLTAYWDVNGWAISRGLHYYANGRAVSQYDRFDNITQAENEFIAVLAQYAAKVKKSLTVSLTDSQFSACVNYAYNRGLGAWNGSVLRKMINANPSNSSIPKQFVIEWGTNQKDREALIKRRAKEGILYQQKDLVNPQNIIALLLGLAFFFWLYQAASTKTNTQNET